jgi:hypothetical protein
MTAIYLRLQVDGFHDGTRALWHTGPPAAPGGAVRRVVTAGQISEAVLARLDRAMRQARIQNQDGAAVHRGAISKIWKFPL